MCSFPNCLMYLMCDMQWGCAKAASRPLPQGHSAAGEYGSRPTATKPVPPRAGQPACRRAQAARLLRSSALAAAGERGG
jgi:hypothetical protein